ncbi:putative calcium-binding protein [Acorus calamus]|uniref:Calcium-binding protein n=1 Tax=Acorus calamus TaxID=4465 RepID=A0AAV9D810_ACOCL|nr:putative calcium-binding protein [Acorus calamus]
MPIILCGDWNGSKRGLSINFCGLRVSCRHMTLLISIPTMMQMHTSRLAIATIVGTYVA